MKWDQSFKTADKVFHDGERERSEQCQISPAFIFSTEEIHFNLWIPKTRQLILGFLWFLLNFCSSGWRNSSPIIEISTNFSCQEPFLIYVTTLEFYSEIEKSMQCQYNGIYIILIPICFQWTDNIKRKNRKDTRSSPYCFLCRLYPNGKFLISRFNQNMLFCLLARAEFLEALSRSGSMKTNLPFCATDCSY